MLLYRLYRALPPQVRFSLKKILGASGHAQSTLDQLKAKKDALGKKRLDKSLTQIVDALEKNNSIKSLRGLRCMDFGAGYVPTDSIAMWLLGAKTAIAVDYNSIMHPESLHAAILKSDLPTIKLLLDRYGVDDIVDHRMSLIETMIRNRRVDMDKLPWKYLAPFDVLQADLDLPEVDFIWSTSVLEHIPPSLLAKLLFRLDECVHGGHCLHQIDLRDHKDFDQNPYGFLDPTQAFDAEREADVRGNAMTMIHWHTLLDNYPNLGLSIISKVPGRIELVPPSTSAGGRLVDQIYDFITIGK